jgi:hypothetical protein
MNQNEESMLAPPPKKQRSEPDKTLHHQVNAVIGQHVVAALGRPAHLREVQVRPLWDNCYRVNVLVGAAANAVTVAHSFFVVADTNGNILDATPKLNRLY